MMRGVNCRHVSQGQPDRRGGGGEEGTEISVPHAVRAFLLKICHKFIAFAREFTVPTPTRPVANGGAQRGTYAL